jgi:hypothetical protein
MDNELQIAIERMKLVLIAASRQRESNDDVAEFVELRRQLMKSRVRDRLPKFLDTCRSLKDFWHFIQPKVDGYRPRQEYISKEFEPALTFVERGAAPSDASATNTAIRMSSGYVHELWTKALDRRDRDPEGAVTAARTLLEAVCKHILDGLQISYDHGADLPALYSAVSKALNLAPSQHTVAVFKQILGGCHSVVEGLGALRNRVGDAHGQGSAPVRPAPRHAELAVNLAGTMATFLWATYEERNKVTS